MTRRSLTHAVFVAMVGAATLSAQSAPPPAQTPVPKPFPGSGGPTVSTPKPPASTEKPSPPVASAAPTNWGAISPLLASIPAYPAAEFLDSFDAGRGQRLFVFGTNDAYAGVVAFYKTQLRKSGEEVSKRPAIQQFDTGSFDANAMDHRPSVIVKDYSWPEFSSYVHVDGTTEKTFKTLIQVIPAGR